MISLFRVLALFASVNIAACSVSKEYENSDIIEANIVESVIHAPVPTNNIDNLLPEYVAARGEKKTVCRNYNTDFSKDVRGWLVEDTMQDTYDIDSYGIKFNLMPPQNYVRKHNERHLPYNEFGGRGPTLNATTYMKYGTVSATMRTAGVGGSVTAFILLADEGDEIDFEILGGEVKKVQSNYFWGKTVEYIINGGTHSVEGGDIDQTFHRYTIEWMPDKITWYVDDKVVREKTRAETCDDTGNCKYPSNPARVQFGLWDGSIEPGTAEWAQGPIDWSQPQSISAYIKDVRVECHPEYNQIVS